MAMNRVHSWRIDKCYTCTYTYIRGKKTLYYTLAKCGSAQMEVANLAMLDTSWQYAAAQSVESLIAAGLVESLSCDYRT